MMVGTMLRLSDVFFCALHSHGTKIVDPFVLLDSTQTNVT